MLKVDGESVYVAPRRPRPFHERRFVLREFRFVLGVFYSRHFGNPVAEHPYFLKHLGVVLQDVYIGAQCPYAGAQRERAPDEPLDVFRGGGGPPKFIRLIEKEIRVRILSCYLGLPQIHSFLAQFFRGGGVKHLQNPRQLLEDVTVALDSLEELFLIFVKPPRFADALPQPRYGWF